MMSMMRARRVLPFLMAVALLAMMAVPVYQQPSPAAAQGAEPLAAPTVTLTGAAACTPENPRRYLVASYGAVEGADRYEYRVKWGRSVSFSEWRRVTRGSGSRWAVSTRPEHYLKPGETYAVQIRAVDSDGVRGAAGFARYSYQVGDFDPPNDVRVSYGTGDDGDYTRARLTWRGDARSGGWFAVQKRVIGKKWQSGPWRKAARVDGDDEASPYHHDVSGLDEKKGYEFRVTGHTPQCQASPWSDIAALWPAPEPPTFETSSGRTDGGAMLGVWITSPQESADYHTFRLDDGEAVRMAEPVMQYRFDVALNREYRLCVSAGNARGESAAACETMTIRPTSPIERLGMEPLDQVAGALDVSWTLAPVVNPTWHDDDEGSTHSPPSYRVALREVGTGDGQWPNADTRFRIVYREGRTGNVVLDNLKGNTVYQVAVRSGYYGEDEYRYATARTLMNPARSVVVGFDDEYDGRAVVGWQAPSDGSQAGYTVVLRETHNNQRLRVKRPGADAVSVAFNGLKTGRWYHVNVRAVGEGNRRSAVKTCYFKHGSDGSQNHAGANTRVAGSSCAAR